MKTIINIITFFLILLFPIQTFASACTCIMDAKSGRVLYGDNLNSEYLIASTTKVMTSLVVLNNININKKVMVSDEVMDAYGSAIYIKPGEKILIKDLLYGLMLRSGNDAAMVLAKNVGGSSLGFAKLMNETAVSIGMKNTKFYNPHGLDEVTENKSSCYDLTLLLREAMKNKNFRKITSTKEYTLKTNFNTYSWHNKNKLLNLYKYADGGKIGYTKRAGHTFVSSATKGDKHIIIATIRDDDMFNNHKRLYEKYFNEYNNYTLLNKNDLRIDYDKNYNLYTNSSFDVLLKKNELKKLKREVIIYKESYSHKDELNYSIGKIRLKLGTSTLTEKNIYAREKNKKEKQFNYNFFSKFKKLLE